MSRNVYVYRLAVEYPDKIPPWPPGVDDEWIQGPEHEIVPHWPRVRQYLSQSGAESCARLLRSMGCTVTITRSQAVIFAASQGGDNG